jgi:hypothetical protein
VVPFSSRLLVALAALLPTRWSDAILRWAAGLARRQPALPAPTERVSNAA